MYLECGEGWDACPRDPSRSFMHPTMHDALLTLFRLGERDEYIMEGQTAAMSHPDETFWLTTDMD